MKNTQNIASLIAQLEYEVGRECYNPNSWFRYDRRVVRNCRIIKDTLVSVFVVYICSTHLF